MTYDQVLLTAAVGVALALTPPILQAHRPSGFDAAMLASPTDSRYPVPLDEGALVPTSSGGDAFLAEGFWTGARD